jgi:hypothetical protein
VLRIGGALNSAPQLLYNGASGRLAFRSTTGEEKIVLDVDGSAYFGGPMTIATGGGIWQGTGSFASPTTGLKLYNSSGIGRLSTYNAGLEQITLNTSGQLVAGQGTTILDRNGLTIIGNESYEEFRAIKFKSGSTLFGRIQGEYVANDYSDVSIWSTHPLSSTAVYLNISARPGGNSGIISSVGDTYLQVATGNISLSAEDFVNLNTPALSVMGDGRFLGGLTIGDPNLDPLTAVLLMKERTSATTATPADTAQIWVQDVAGVQKFYIKFANGVQREIATA